MWRIDSKKTVLKNPFITVVQKHLYKNDDGPHEYYSIEFPDFCNILPVTADGHVVMVRQFRVGLEAETLELPGGLVDDSDANPEASAVRELREETGYGPAKDGRVIPLGFIHPNPAIQANRCHLFAVGPVEWKGEQSLDPLEHAEVVLVPLGEIPDRILKGEITHALILNAFQLLALRQGGQGLVSAMDKLRR